MFRARFFIVLVLISFLCFPGRAMAQGRDDPVTIRWPSPEFPTIQSALGALPDGGVVEIAEGEYFVDEPIFITGKRVVIKGAGSGVDLREYKDKDCRESKLDDISDYYAYVDEIIGTGKRSKEPVTRLIGPPPQPVFLDRAGNLSLPAQDVEGLLNCITGDVVVRDIWLSGFDAGIVIKSTRAVNMPSVITDVHISDTGRGILALSSLSSGEVGEVTVANTVIRDTLWNGISVVGGEQPTPQKLPKYFVVYLSIIINTKNVGFFYKNAMVSIHDIWIFNCMEGGILGYNSWGYIADSLFTFNNFAGIALYQCPWFYIVDNKISSTDPSPASGKFGDGITLALSGWGGAQNITVSDNVVSYSERAGLSNFGSFAALANNKFKCAAFELEGENHMGQNYGFADNGGNGCGCPTPTGSCVVETAGIAPPEPAAPIE